MQLEQAKPIGDVLSLGAIFASLLGYMPNIAAAAAFVWTCIRIYETKTVQKWLGRK